MSPRNWDQKPIRMKSTLLMVAIPSWPAFPFLQTPPHLTKKAWKWSQSAVTCFFLETLFSTVTLCRHCASFPHTTYVVSLSWNIKSLCKDAPTQNHYWLRKVSAKIWRFPWKWSLVWQTLRFKPICHRMNRQWPHHLESQQLKAALHMFKLCISSKSSNVFHSNGTSMLWKFFSSSNHHLAFGAECLPFGMRFTSLACNY